MASATPSRGKKRAQPTDMEARTTFARLLSGDDKMLDTWCNKNEEYHSDDDNFLEGRNCRVTPGNWSYYKEWCTGYFESLDGSASSSSAAAAAAVPSQGTGSDGADGGIQEVAIVLKPDGQKMPAVVAATEALVADLQDANTSVELRRSVELTIPLLMAMYGSHGFSWQELNQKGKRGGPAAEWMIKGAATVWILRGPGVVRRAASAKTVLRTTFHANVDTSRPARSKLLHTTNSAKEVKDLWKLLNP